MFEKNMGICDLIGIALSAALVRCLYAIIVKSHQQRKIAISAKGMDSSRPYTATRQIKGSFSPVLFPQRKGSFSTTLCTSKFI